ncbi:MAG: cbb3-type cytochrome c oxidase subunit II, partial [Myxococcota bacterium]
SQMVRPFRQEIERYGEYSKPGESVYDHPFLWGSKRNGPDLARLGGKYPHLWHVRHMEDPRSTSPKSIMPPYPWLLSKNLDLSQTQDKLEVMAMLGVPYSLDAIDSAKKDAETQAVSIAAEIEVQGGPSGLANKEIVALVAYLQRLGVDIKKSPENKAFPDKGRQIAQEGLGQ